MRTVRRSGVVALCLMAAVLAYPSSVLGEVVPYDVSFSGDGAYEYAASAHDMGIVSVARRFAHLLHQQLDSSTNW